jgi:hypothetical protein
VGVDLSPARPHVQLAPLDALPQNAERATLHESADLAPMRPMTIIGSTFVDSEDEEELVNTVMNVKDGVAVTTGGNFDSWRLDYVIEKLGGPKRGSTAAETKEERFSRIVGEEPSDAVTILLCAYADHLKHEAQGKPGERKVLPLNDVQRDKIAHTLKTLADRLVDKAVAPSTLVHKERSLRYWFTHCDLMGWPRVIRTAADASNLAEFAGLMGMVWPVGGKNERRGLAPETVGGAVSNIRSWHAITHSVDVKALEFRATRVCKGLKNLRGPQLPQLRLSKKCYKYIVTRLRQQGDPESLAIADAISWCYEALFRISEIGDTLGHNTASGTQRYLRHDDVAVIRTSEGRPRKLDWTLRKTKQKEEIQNRSLWAAGTQENPDDDVLAAAGDFVPWMAARFEKNETFLLAHPDRRQSLAFVNFNGEPVSSDAVKTAIENGVQACFERGWCPDPSTVRVGTHTCRRGGATLYYENGISDKSIMWLGRWVSLAWLSYPEMTDKAARRMTGLVSW